MTVRLYKVTGKYEGYVLAHRAADATRHAMCGVRDCARAHDVTAEVAVEAVGPLAKRQPGLADLGTSEVGLRLTWTVEQWAAAAPADAAAEAERLRAEANHCDRRAAKLRDEADELARIAAKAKTEETTSEPVAEAAREAMLRDPRWKASDLDGEP